MNGLGIQAAQDREPGVRDPAQQGFAGAQAQVFGQVGQDQPAFAACAQVRWQAGQKSFEHLAAFVVHRLFQQAGGAGWQPRRVAHHHSRLALREQVGWHQLHLVLQAQALQVVQGACQGAFRQVGTHHLRCTTPCQHRRQNASAHANVKRHGVRLEGFGQGGVGDQGHILAAHGGEHAVVRVDAQGFAQGGYLDPVFAPLERANDALQTTQ